MITSEHLLSFGVHVLYYVCRDVPAKVVKLDEEEEDVVKHPSSVMHFTGCDDNTTRETIKVG